MEDYKIKQKEFEEACIPLMKYLAEKHTPHTKGIVECNTCELVDGTLCYNNDEFILD